jgi:alpha-glucosidase
MHKPTGMNRTYPNILNYEGVHGLECMKWENGTDFMRNDLLGLYCRMSAGPMDYTPGAMLNMTRQQYKANFQQPGSQGTRVHQMALMALYEAPLQMLCDSPTQYLRNRECFEFMAKVPVVWDETVGLPGEMETSAAMARRKDDVWYAAAICSWNSCTMEIDTSFLGDGKWRVEVFEDGVNADRDATDYVKRSMSVKAGEKIKINLAPGGGWIARFVRKGLFW